MTDYSDGDAILASLGVTPILNAGGPVTRFSGTRPRPEAMGSHDGDVRTIRRVARTN